MDGHQRLVYLPFDRLPRELLYTIINDLPSKDLFSLRFSSRRLAEELVPIVFLAITLWLGSKSLQRLTDISEKPSISQHVRRNSVSSLVLDREIQGPCMRHQRKTLTQALSRLSKMESIEINYGASTMSLESLALIRKNDFAQSVASGSSLHHAKGMLKRATCDVLMCLSQALRDSQRTLKVFWIGRKDHNEADSDQDEASLFEIEDRFNLISPAIRAMTYITNHADILHELRELHVHCKDTTRLEWRQRLAIFRSVLQVAPSLEVITLESPQLPWIRRVESLAQVFEDITLSHLRCLNLYVCELPIDYIFSVIQCFWMSLVEVHLKLGIYEPRTMGGTGHFKKLLEASDGDRWFPLLAMLRGVDFPHLKVFTIIKNKPDDDLKVQDYILRMTDSNPLIRAGTEVREGHQS